MPLLVLLPRRLLVSRLTDVVAGNVPARTTRATIGTYRRKTRFFPNVGRIVADKIHGLASRLKQDSLSEVSFPFTVCLAMSLSISSEIFLSVT
jgi:hypothetical protein